MGRRSRGQGVVAADDVKAGPSPGKGLDRKGETRPYLAMLARAEGAPNPNAGDLRSRDRTRRGTGPIGLLCGDSSVERAVERFVVEFFDCSCVETWSTLGSTRRGAQLPRPFTKVRPAMPVHRTQRTGGPSSVRRAVDRGRPCLISGAGSAAQRRFLPSLGTDSRSRSGLSKRRH